MEPQLASEIEIWPTIATREQYVAECRRLLAVRWQHQGRSERGVDCIGLLVVPALTLGLLEPEDDEADYQRGPKGDHLDCLLHRHCRRLSDWREAREADILAVKFSDQPQHVIVVTRPTQWGPFVIHAWGNSEMGGEVIEHRLDDLWLKSHRARIHAAFSIKGVG